MADDARFKYFVEKIMPNLRQSASHSNTLIFIPSYFDFVRVRNYMNEHNYSSAELCEYTDTKDISRARTKFFNGDIDYLLHTERFHFYRRLVFVVIQC